MVAFGQVEDICPIHAIVFHQGRISGCAGRHQELDGGLRVACVQAEDGTLLWYHRPRFGIADATSAGAIHGSGQGSPRTWVNRSKDSRHTAAWAVNGDIAIVDNQVRILPNAHTGLTLAFDGEPDVLVNEANSTSKEATQDLERFEPVR